MSLEIEYKLYITDVFEKKFHKIIPGNKKEDAKRRIQNLKNNPYSGKPLGTSYFRELKLDKFRIYYEIYEKEIFILLLNVSNKKKSTRNNRYN